MAAGDPLAGVLNLRWRPTVYTYRTSYNVYSTRRAHKYRYYVARCTSTFARVERAKMPTFTFVPSLHCFVLRNASWYHLPSRCRYSIAVCTLIIGFCSCSTLCICSSVAHRYCIIFVYLKDILSWLILCRFC